jgi:hypothetical protein
MIFDTWRSALVLLGALGSVILLVWGGSLLEQQQTIGWAPVFLAIVTAAADIWWIVQLLRNPPRPRRKRDGPDPDDGVSGSPRHRVTE